MTFVFNELLISHIFSFVTPSQSVTQLCKLRFGLFSQVLHPQKPKIVNKLTKFTLTKAYMFRTIWTKSLISFFKYKNAFLDCQIFSAQFYFRIFSSSSAADSINKAQFISEFPCACHKNIFVEKIAVVFL